MARASGWSEDEVERRAAPLAAVLRRVWRAIARVMSGRVAGASVATAADVDALPRVWSTRLESDVLAYVEDVYWSAAEDLIQQVELPPSTLVGDDLVEAHLRAARNRLRGIGDDVWLGVRDQLTEGNRLGESIPQLAARVRGTAKISDARALTIARTEVHAAAEAAAFDQALFVDATGTKTWLATEDSRTRETHRRADGQRVRIAESFDVGGSPLRFPGDPLGEPGETVNCRCSVTYDFDTITPMSDDPTDDLVQAVAAAFAVPISLVAAAKKWNPQAHPRGNDGKFIKKGAVSTLLSKKKPLMADVTQAVAELDADTWVKLTESQKEFVTTSVEKLPSESSFKDKAVTKLLILQDLEIAKNSPVTPHISKVSGTTSPPATVDAVDALLDKNGVGTTTGDVIDALESLNATKWQALTAAQKKQLTIHAGKLSNAAPSFVELKEKLVGLAGDDEKSAISGTLAAIAAHKGATPGSPAKITTGLIWGKHESGTVILEVSDAQGTNRVLWNGKKYEIQFKDVFGDFKTVQELSKKDTYAELKGDTHWTVPGGDGDGDGDEVTDEDASTSTQEAIDQALNAWFAAGIDDPETGVKAAQLMDQSAWDDMTPSAKKLLYGDISVLDSSETKTALLQKLIQLNGGAAPTGAKKLAKKAAPKAPPPLSVVDDDSAPTLTAPKSPLTSPLSKTVEEQKDEYLGYLKSGLTISSGEAVTIVNNMTITEWGALTDNQKTKLALSVDNAIINGVLDAGNALKGIEAFQSASVPKTTSVTPSPPDYPYESIITSWSGLLTGKKFTAGQVIALSGDGQWQLEQSDMKPGEVVVVNITTGDDDKTYIKSDVVAGDIKFDYPGDWIVPPVASTSSSSPSTSPAPSPSLTPATGVSPVDAPTPPLLGDTSGIAEVTKTYLKKHLSAAKVGYWSKPEAIWDQIKQLQALFPHPTKPGESEYSALQIIKSLDDVTKTKEPSPFEKKMIKWAASAKGKAYTGNVDISSSPATFVSTPATTSPPTTAPSVSPAGKLDVGTGDISHIPEAQQQKLYDTFKKQPATFLTSPDVDIYAAAKTIADDHGISLLQMLRVIDAVGAQKVSKPDEHLFEKKIKAWLGTPQGAAVASGQPIPLPPTPAYSVGVGPQNVKSFDATSGLNYQTVTTAQALNLWKSFTAAAPGDWTPGQRSALKSYTGGVYYSINAYHYGKLDSISETNAKIAKNAQAGMRSSTTPLLLHRGVAYAGVANAKNHADLEKAVGQTWKSGGFFSTSVGGKAAFSSYPVLLEVEAPPGTPMAYLKPISNYGSENEMLLAAGLNYKIVSVKKVGKKSVVRLRVVPEEATI